MSMKNPLKTKILLLGYSYIAKKSVIRAMQNNPYMALVGIASQKNYHGIPSEYNSYDSYEDAIKNSDCDAVYISLHNSDHYKWIMESLKFNKHVICDKPAVLSSKQAMECYKKAGDKLIVFESIPYQYHAQHKILKRGIEQQKYPLQKITAHFGFPPFEKNNFRNFAKLGGGCLYDIGPYMVSAGQLYFSKRATRVYCSSYTPKSWDAPTSASVMIQYGRNQVLQGHIGFNLEYRNNLNLWGYDFNYAIDRAFSTPWNFPNFITYKSKDKIKNIPISPSDSFSEMFSFFHKLLHDKSDRKGFNRKFLEQAIQMDAMIKSAETQKPENIEYGDIK